MNEASGQKRTPWGASNPNEPLFIAESSEMLELKTLAARASGGDAKVLITGESGVGKDVIARFIHARSSRSQRAFVAVNCAAFSETLLESELFGHVKGSFTGAHRDKIGKLQQAHKGTMFLDEVGEMSLRMQALLLRFLESGEIQSVGDDGRAGKVDVRVISATNRDIPTLIAAGQFREDLMYRIRVIHLQVPPLRARREDIRPLIELTIKKGGRPISLSDEAMRALEQYRWPGNVRQLQNMIEQLTWMSAKDLVTIDDLPGALRMPAGAGILPARERRRQVADDLYHGLVTGVYVFWDHTYPLFMNRDVTRHDLRELVRRGLATTCGNYRALVKLFRMPPKDYKRFLNFLAAHDCRVDFREFRTGNEHVPTPRPPKPVVDGTGTPAEPKSAEPTPTEPASAWAVEPTGH